MGTSLKLSRIHCSKKIHTFFFVIFRSFLFTGRFVTASPFPESLRWRILFCFNSSPLRRFGTFTLTLIGKLLPENRKLPLTKTILSKHNTWVNILVMCYVPSASSSDESVSLIGSLAFISLRRTAFLRSLASRSWFSRIHCC